jgi:hypothetical protein
MKMRAFILSVMVSGVVAQNPCACKYDTGLPKEFWEGGQYANLPGIAGYGTVCGAWESIPDTPWYDGSCNTSKGVDYCTTDSSWCDDAWCYVDPACPTFTNTTVFSDVAAAPKLGYSYETCGAKNCYTNKTAKGCPHDPLGACPDPCACLYAGTGLPESFWKGGQYENMAMISQYGASCAGWDSIPGTPFYSGHCNISAGKDYCTRSDSWCPAAWCYVDKKCPTWVSTTVFKDVPGAPAVLGYSYQKCGAPNCYTDPSATGCPYNWDGTCCQCQYATGLPKAFWAGNSQYNSLSMIAVYGTKCAPWDSVQGTPYYSQYCINTTAGYCGSDEWCNDPWCYVDKNRCNSWVATSVFKGEPGVPADFGYSYSHCGSPNCYTASEYNKEKCPYDPFKECSYKELSCSEVKGKYKSSKCCGNPTNMVKV